MTSSELPEHIDDQHVTYRMRKRRKSFMSNTKVVVKGLKKKMSELLIATSNNSQKLKSWSSAQNNKLAEVVQKFKGKNKLAEVVQKFKGKKKKKKNEETAEKYDDETLSKDSMLKRLHELNEKLEKTMVRVGVLEEVFERESVRKCSTTGKDEDEQMSDSDDESESGYCTPT